MLGTTASILLGSLALGGATAAISSMSKASSKKYTSAAESEANKAAKEAEQQSLLEQQEADKTKKARQALLETPTSGFGPNTNLARSFLTSL